MMKIIRESESGFKAAVEEICRGSSLFDPVIEDRARSILAAVRDRGDEALLEFTEKFDGARLSAEQLAVTPPELLEASLLATPDFRMAVSAARTNIERFSRKALRKAWRMRNAQGGEVGEKFDPFQRVGIYVPGGTAPLVSTALMTVVLAKVAGCPEIVVCTPGGKTGKINPALLFAVRSAGATEVYRAGGAQAIAAMGYGTKTIRRVQKIFGPGNAYVVAAKRLLFGHVSIDLLPGPSELLVLADESAQPEWIAADMIAQAEHGSGHERVWLVTTSGAVLRQVEKAIARQTAEAIRREFVERALQANGYLIEVKTMESGIALANRLAPEHCEVMTRNAKRVAQEIQTAGALFLGGLTPTVLGDYVAGPSHTLPTGGAGAAFAGLTVDQFQRRTSVVQYDASSLKKSVPILRQFAAMEGLDAHARSAMLRLERKGRKGRGQR